MINLQPEANKMESIPVQTNKYKYKYKQNCMAREVLYRTALANKQ